MWKLGKGAARHAAETWLADENAKLLERVARREPGAVEAFIDEYGGMILALSRRYLVPLGEDPEDSVQEIFMEIWKHASRFDRKLGSEAAFVATIAHRRLIDKRRRTTARPTVQLEAGAQVRANTEMPHSASSMREEVSRAQRAFEQLDAAERQVLYLAIHGGMSHERIATEVNIPVGTVKSRVRRGLQRLREVFAASSGDQGFSVARAAGGDA